MRGDRCEQPLLAALARRPRGGVPGPTASRGEEHRSDPRLEIRCAPLLRRKVEPQRRRLILFLELNDLRTLLPKYSSLPSLVALLERGTRSGSDAREHRSVPPGAEGRGGGLRDARAPIST